jgi:hypothetical protein
MSLNALAASGAEAAKPSAPATPTTTPSEQTWICGREHENYAWGYRRAGMVLDASGNIWTYEISKPRGWNPPDMKRLTEADLHMRYKTATAVAGKKVPSPEIAKQLPLIAAAARAKRTKPSQSGADSGSTLVYCYTYDARARVYSQVMLDETGDWKSTNRSQAAKSLTAWLDGLFKPPSQIDQ